MRTQLTRTDFYKLQGLLTLCQSFYTKLKYAERAAEELLNLDDAGTHSSLISEAIYCNEDFDAEDFCKKFKIKIDKK